LITLLFDVNRGLGSAFATDLVPEATAVRLTIE
jgi:hypothetical protein